MTDLSSKEMCDGCGEKSSGLTFYKLDDEDDDLMYEYMKYCPGCDSYRKMKDIEPDEHTQFGLLHYDANDN